MTDIDALSSATEWHLRFEYARPPISLNDRLHHHVKARLVRQVREDTALHAAIIPPLGRCEVSLVWYVTDNRKRDEDNPVPTLKAMCDELVTAGVVPDDTSRYMRKLMPTIKRANPGDTAHMVLRVSRIPEDAA